MPDLGVCSLVLGDEGPPILRRNTPKSGLRTGLITDMV
jgi:hypothetical protein